MTTVTYRIKTTDGRDFPVEYATQDEAAEAIRAAYGWGDVVLDFHSDDYPVTALPMERTSSRWWTWHDADSSRASGGEDAVEATADADARCEEWLGRHTETGPWTHSPQIVEVRQMSNATTSVEIFIGRSERAVMEWDGSQASAPIRLDGVTTPYQTADARHDTEQAVRLALSYAYGPVYETREAARADGRSVGADNIVIWDDVTYETVDAEAD